jgi:transcription factor IIIB subunit 2
VWGRTIEIVAAASVYIAIWQTATTGYLLVDVANNLSCGVFELGAIALRLSKTVCEEIPVLDPTLYIDCFTDELDFGQHSSEIKEIALHIIRRLDHDWIQTGSRRESAARIYGHPVPKETIMKCPRVWISTINKRLNEVARANMNEL